MLTACFKCGLFAEQGKTILYPASYFTLGKGLQSSPNSLLFTLFACHCLLPDMATMIDKAMVNRSGRSASRSPRSKPKALIWPWLVGHTAPGDGHLPFNRHGALLSGALPTNVCGKVAWNANNVTTNIPTNQQRVQGVAVKFAQTSRKSTLCNTLSPGAQYRLGTQTLRDGAYIYISFFRDPLAPVLPQTA